jgi:hypothetical protein
MYARRKAYEQEAIKQAGIRARLSAQRQYGMFSGLVKPKVAVVKKQPKKHHKKRAVKRRRMMVRYVYR